MRTFHALKTFLDWSRTIKERIMLSRMNSKQLQT